MHTRSDFPILFSRQGKPLHCNDLSSQSLTPPKGIRMCVPYPSHYLSSRTQKFSLSSVDTRVRRRRLLLFVENARNLPLSRLSQENFSYLSIALIFVLSFYHSSYSFFTSSLYQSSECLHTKGKQKHAKKKKKSKTWPDTQMPRRGGKRVCRYTQKAKM